MNIAEVVFRTPALAGVTSGGRGVDKSEGAGILRLIEKIIHALAGLARFFLGGQIIVRGAYLGTRS